jgi:opacity protein-like surface antigen
MYMRKYLLAAVAAAAMATPAVARDGVYYVGGDVGFLKAQDLKLRTTADFLNLGTRNYDEGVVVDFNSVGFDGDLNAGYDFGMFRVEGEVAYKSSGVAHTRLDEVLLGNLTNEAHAGTSFTNQNYRFDGGNLHVLSGMVNAMLDFGDDEWGGFAGVGGGLARVRVIGDSQSKFAWQAMAGIRHEISPNLDLSLKYRYFNTGKLNLANEFDLGAAGQVPFTGSGYLHTHSILVGLTYNFAAPPPPPPPPPAPVERGERGR